MCAWPHQHQDALLPLHAHSHYRNGAAADAFNKWEAGQRLAKKLLIKLYNAAKSADKVGCKPMCLLLRMQKAHNVVL